jgi:hypothetical protein
MQVTIQGYQFTVPDEAIDYAVGYVIASDGEARALIQTKVENLRNAFARRVKYVVEKNDATLSQSTLAKLQEEFNEFACDYKFSLRMVSARRNKLEREIRKMVAEDLSRAHFAKHGEKPDKESLEEAIDQVLAVKFEDYKRLVQEREKIGLTDLERIGL